MPPPQAWHWQFQRSHVTWHTLTSVITLAAIQFRADQCIQHTEHPGQSERENHSKQWWAILQTVIIAAIEGMSCSKYTPSPAH